MLLLENHLSLLNLILTFPSHYSGENKHHITVLRPLLPPTFQLKLTLLYTRSFHAVAVPAGKPAFWLKHKASKFCWPVLRRLPRSG
jgi:hypothetical protein